MTTFHQSFNAPIPPSGYEINRYPLTYITATDKSSGESLYWCNHEDVWHNSIDHPTRSEKRFEGDAVQFFILCGVCGKPLGGMMGVSHKE
jgi:hypothetical protein